MIDEVSLTVNMDISATVRGYSRTAARSGSLARLRLCMVMHVASVEGLARGRARGAAGQDWGIRIGPPRTTGVRNGSATANSRCARQKHAGPRRTGGMLVLTTNS